MPATAILQVGGNVVPLCVIQGFPGGSDGKESGFNARDLGLIPGSGRSPGEENAYLLQYSYLENSMDRGAWTGYWGCRGSD